MNKHTIIVHITDKNMNPDDYRVYYVPGMKNTA